MRISDTVEHIVDYGGRLHTISGPPRPSGDWSMSLFCYDYPKPDIYFAFFVDSATGAKQCARQKLLGLLLRVRVPVKTVSLILEFFNKITKLPDFSDHLHCLRLRKKMENQEGWEEELWQGDEERKFPLKDKFTMQQSFIWWGFKDFYGRRVDVLTSSEGGLMSLRKEFTRSYVRRLIVKRWNPLAVCERCDQDFLNYPFEAISKHYQQNNCRVATFWRELYYRWFPITLTHFGAGLRRYEGPSEHEVRAAYSSAVRRELEHRLWWFKQALVQDNRNQQRQQAANMHWGQLGRHAPAAWRHEVRFQGDRDAVRVRGGHLNNANGRDGGR